MLFQRAVAIAKKQLDVTGTIDPTALFVYGENFEDAEESATKVVSIGWKDEIQKEIMRTRVHEKAQRENASALVLLMPVHASPAHKGQCVLSGAAPRQRAEASLTYALDGESNAFIFSELTWREGQAGDFFLEGLFTEP